MRLILPLLWTLWAAFAVASEGPLQVERARAALSLHHTDQALELAIQAVESDPTEWTAHRSYLAASEQAGLLAQAEAELVDLRTEDPVAAMVWAWWRVRRGEQPLAELEQAAARVPGSGATALAWVAAGQNDLARARELLRGPRDPSVAWLTLRLDLMEGLDRQAARQARRWWRSHPHRPEVLEELWTRHRGEASRPLERVRRRALHRVGRELRARWDDPLFLYRALRVYQAAGDSAAARQVADGIEALGDPRPLHHLKWSAAMRQAMGQTLAQSSAPELPHGAPDELAEIVAVLERHALDRGRPEVAIDARRALAARTDRFQDWMDLAALLREEGQVDPEVARRALDAAVRPASDDLGRLDTARQRAEVAGALRLVREAGDGEEGLGAALDSLLRRLEGARVTAQDDALEWVARATGEPAHQELRRAVLRSLLSPRDAKAWAQRGAALESIGARHGAFVSFAVAAQLGQPDEDALVRTYRGLARPGPVAAALAAVWADGMEAVGWLEGEPEEPPSVEAPPLPAAPEAKTTPRQVAGAVGLPRPRVGRAMPSWEATDRDGEPLQGEGLRGTAYVLAVWASWCGPCHIELPEIHEAVQELTAEGRAVQGIAVSVDERERVWRRADERGSWKSLKAAWAPELSAELRIHELPVTFVVAADGTLVHHQVGYDPAFGANLAELLRRHAD